MVAVQVKSGTVSKLMLMLARRGCSEVRTEAGHRQGGYKHGGL